jgi:hypothetical protein
MAAWVLSGQGASHFVDVRVHPSATDLEVRYQDNDSQYQSQYLETRCPGNAVHHIAKKKEATAVFKHQIVE